MPFTLSHRLGYFEDADYDNLRSSYDKIRKTLWSFVKRSIADNFSASSMPARFLYL